MFLKAEIEGIKLGRFSLYAPIAFNSIRRDNNYACQEGVVVEMPSF